MVVFFGSQIVRFSDYDPKVHRTDERTLRETVSADGLPEAELLLTGLPLQRCKQLYVFDVWRVCVHNSVATGDQMRIQECAVFQIDIRKQSLITVFFANIKL